MTQKITRTVAATGNSAVAEAMRQINPDVIAAFPITPSTGIIEDFAHFVADGKVNTELITVESEHSAMSACLGAAAAGGRVMTATSSNGLALMWEMLYIASAMRQPIIMTVVNRALSAPINIHCDHSDSMGARDAGWIQIYAENNQEAYDNMVMAPRIAEHPEIRLPLMICMDGFIISHAIETMCMEDDAHVREFIGPFRTVHPLLDTERPVTIGALDLHDYYMEHKRAQHVGMMKSRKVIQEVSAEFDRVFGRKYGLFDSYRLEDAECVIVAINSVAGEIREVIDDLRAAGKKVGLLKIRLYRPFPYDDIREALKNARAIAVLDRSDSIGAFGPLFREIRTCLYDLEVRPLVYNRIYGLGGRELFLEDIEAIFNECEAYMKNNKIEKLFDYLNVRGG